MKVIVIITIMKNPEYYFLFITYITVIIIDIIY